ncbi:MAG: tRNA (cytidine(34)-2'-O)-methyltransferase [Thermoanaerobaculia bacterium]
MPLLERLHVALVEPEIHWNTGNAGRTCLATGARLHLVGPLGFSLAEREVRRSGLDYWERVDLERWESWPAFEAALPGLGAPYFFSADADLDYWDVEYPSAVTLIFGRESQGLPQELRERYRHALVRMPVADSSVRSLNLSTCVGIAVYEVLRQRSLRARKIDRAAAGSAAGALQP